MDGTIITLDFKRHADGKVDLKDSDNLKKLHRYILPIIYENTGWGTGHLTKEAFEENPELFQNDIDATVIGHVHVFLDGNKEPQAVLEYNTSTLADDTKRNEFIVKLLSEDESSLWEKFDLSQEVLDSIFEKRASITLLLTSKPLYHSIGVVLHPSLQNKKTGIIEQFQDIFEGGITFGWTSNPIALRVRQRKFPNTYFFPLLDEIFGTSVEALTSLVLVASELLTSSSDSWKNLPFGALQHPYFVEERGEEYKKIAKDMNKVGKISNDDLKRLLFVLSKKQCAGALVSFS